MSNYKVGQVLFLAPKGKVQLVPIQVAEEITKKTLLGDQVTYMVKAGTEGKLYDVATLDGEVFETSSAALKALTERSTRAIAKIVSNAVEQSKALYPSSFEAASNNVIDLIKSVEEVSESLTTGEVAMVTLEDGTKARISVGVTKS